MCVQMLYQTPYSLCSVACCKVPCFALHRLVLFFHSQDNGAIHIFHILTFLHSINSHGSRLMVMMTAFLVSVVVVRSKHEL